ESKSAAIGWTMSGAAANFSTTSRESEAEGMSWAIPRPVTASESNTSPKRKQGPPLLALRTSFETADNDIRQASRGTSGSYDGWSELSGTAARKGRKNHTSGRRPRMISPRAAAGKRVSHRGPPRRRYDDRLVR